MRIFESRGIWVKICGMTRAEDVDAAIEAGASAIGFVFAPSVREVSIRAAAKMRERVPDGILVVGVFDNAGRIARVATAVALDAVQLPLAADLDDLPDGVGVLRTVRVRGAQDLVDLPSHEVVHLDSYVEGLLGGTGQQIDSSLIDTSLIRGQWVLAGGLTAASVAQAISELEPDGVDVSSGVESQPGIKDHQKVEAFISAARSS